MTDRKRLLDNASEYVLKQRNKSYGEPDEDFQRIARIASAMGFRMAPEGSNGPHRELSGSDVALFMIALKTSRLVWSPDHEDSWTDIAGYAACGFETANLESARRTKEILYPDEPEEVTGLSTHPPYRATPESRTCGTGCSPRLHLLAGDCRYRLAGHWLAEPEGERP